ncbi:NusB antitermination factor [Acetitomaculum ruminis DSM 5522]|uniref:NusB antitermination factor n=1 Tax=Acetitomaculum ruminis DSM 5522 TaxID=1120918 RepID=A0A1I0VV41_9FIRM|nr:transcription antitermination factor NusB [Acetitomaculum ruminis]SFA79546.1 NusB antitermination factor [Acetitomaculum ruminis DSM 5522]
MNRRQLRENIFRLLYRKEFYENEEMNEQVQLFFENLVGEDEEDDIALENIRQEDKDEIIEKYEKVVEKISELDSDIEKISKEWDIKRICKTDLNIIRLALYEARYDDNVPVSVAINEAVELGKMYGQDEKASFINGILAQLVN